MGSEKLNATFPQFCKQLNEKTDVRWKSLVGALIKNNCIGVSIDPHQPFSNHPGSPQLCFLSLREVSPLSDICDRRPDRSIDSVSARANQANTWPSSSHLLCWLKRRRISDSTRLPHKQVGVKGSSWRVYWERAPVWRDLWVLPRVRVHQYLPASPQLSRSIYTSVAAPTSLLCPQLTCSSSHVSLLKCRTWNPFSKISKWLLSKFLPVSALKVRWFKKNTKGMWSAAPDSRVCCFSSCITWRVSPAAAYPDVFYKYCL